MQPGGQMWPPTGRESKRINGFEGSVQGNWCNFSQRQIECLYISTEIISKTL